MKKHPSKSGFSLTELAFIIAILGVVVGVTISTGKVQYDYATITSTSNKLDTVRQALLTFKKKAQRLPCPAAGNAAPGSATYGVEAASCDPAACPAGITCSTDNIIIGTVPFATIGMNAEAALDGWDNRITYAVDYSHVTNNGSGLGRISVRDVAGNEITNSDVLGKAIFVLVSHGKNGNGAWSKQGSVITSCTTTATAKDVEDCDGDSVFTSSMLNEGDVAANYYDDVVLWHSQGSQTVSDEKSPRVVDFIAERNNSCVVLDTGLLSCVGLNDNGQLGNGTTTNSITFQEVAGGFKDWTAITIDAENACGIRGDSGSVYCWGDNSFGELGDGTTGTDRLTPVAVRPETGSNTGWTVIDMDGRHACGIREGHLLCWGDDTDGQLGDNTTAGSSTNRPREVQGNYSDWIAVGLGVSHTCGIRDIGGVKRAYCWGDNTNGKLGDGTATPRYALTEIGGGAYTDWKKIDSNQNFTCGLRDNGELWCWGLGTSGQLGRGSSADSSSPVRVQDSTGPTYWSDWVSFSVSSTTACGVRSNGELYCWGSESSNELLGNGSATGSKQRPFLAAGNITDWFKVVMGGNTACAMRESGNLYCWGQNTYAQVGNTTTVSPVNAPSVVTAY